MTERTHREFPSSRALGARTTPTKAAVLNAPPPKALASSQTLPPPQSAGTFDSVEVVTAGEAPLARFSLYSRDGKMHSYAYSLVGLIESPSGELIRLDCNCGSIDSIEIAGCGLRRAAEMLAAGRVQAFRETASHGFSPSESCVSSITINRTRKG